MKKFSLILLLLAFFAVPAFTQDNEDAGDEGIPVDFNEYLKTTRPGLDPGGKHDIFDLKNPTDPDERHAYTQAMLHIISEYMQTLDMGATISKLFDQYSRQKEGTQPTFKVMHAMVLVYYPPGQPNITAAQKLLREAAAKTDDYAYPHYLLAQFEFVRFRQMPGQTSPSKVLELLESALAIRPKFLRAVMMKSQVLLSARPPKSEEVREMLQPRLAPGKLPADVNDFEDLLKLYADSHTATQLHDKIEELLKSSKLSARHRVRARLLAASIHLKNLEIDDAVADLESALEFTDVKQHPGDAIGAHQTLALCWRAKANEVRRADPKLQDPEKKTEFDRYVDAARKEHLTAAGIEREHMPKVLRGQHAREYVNFLSQNLEEHEEALDWLTRYLENTELSGAQRRAMINLQQNLSLLVNPTENGLIDLYELHVANDDMERLAISLALARENAKLRDEHFRKPRSLRFFIGQIDNRLQVVTMYAAFLAADTALQINHKSVREAGAAIAARYEKEIELQSDQQVDLQEALLRTLRDLCGPAAQARGVRHLAKLLEESATISRMHMSKVLTVWKDEAFLRSLDDNSPGSPGFLVSRDAKKAADWLRKLADGLDRHADLVHAEWAVFDGLNAINRLQPEEYVKAHVSGEVAKTDTGEDLEETLDAMRARFANISIVSTGKSDDSEDVVVVGIEVSVKDSEETGELTVNVQRVGDEWQIAEGLAGKLLAAMPEPAPEEPEGDDTEDPEESSDEDTAD